MPPPVSRREEGYCGLRVEFSGQNPNQKKQKKPFCFFSIRERERARERRERGTEEQRAEGGATPVAVAIVGRRRRRIWWRNFLIPKKEREREKKRRWLTKEESMPGFWRRELKKLGLRRGRQLRRGGGVFSSKPSSSDGDAQWIQGRGREVRARIRVLVNRRRRKKKESGGAAGRMRGSQRFFSDGCDPPATMGFFFGDVDLERGRAPLRVSSGFGPRLRHGFGHIHKKKIRRSSNRSSRRRSRSKSKRRNRPRGWK